MAAADYRLCDKCGSKTFYDVNLNYEWSTKNNPIPPEELIRGEHHKLQYLGDWAVLCRDCAKQWRCEIVPIAREEEGDPICDEQRGEWIAWNPVTFADTLPPDSVYWVAARVNNGPIYYGAFRADDHWGHRCVCAYWSIPLPPPYTDAGKGA